MFAQIFRKLRFKTLYFDLNASYLKPNVYNTGSNRVTWEEIHGGFQVEMQNVQ